MKNTAVLRVQCPDRKGLDAAISEFIYRYDGNILHFEQHQAGEERYYLARVEWDLADFHLDLKDFDAAFGPVARKFGTNWAIGPGHHRPRVVLFIIAQRVNHPPGLYDDPFLGHIAWALDNS